jgi:HAD superfamily hydrolase (TIGR01662 family)
MLLTSVVIPPLAVYHRLRGSWRYRSAPAWPVPVRAVVFDRDGTLVHDVPYNGDPSLVRPMDGAREALAQLRQRGIRVAVATNQSGVARGLLEPADVAAVNEAVTAAVGPVDSWQVCPHGPGDGCGCRKPGPGLVAAAAASLGVSPVECAVIGDIGADVEAARAAGAASVLVPTPQTRAHEAAEAPVVAPDLPAAVGLVLSGRVR